MTKVKIALDTTTDVATFVNIANTIDEAVYLEDDNGFVVNAKSLMGCLYGTTEFNGLYVKSDYENLSTKFMSFMI